MVVELSTEYRMVQISTKNSNRRGNNSSERRTKSGRNPFYLLFVIITIATSAEPAREIFIQRI